MNIRANIDWIKRELEHVDDPLLIQKVKDLLQSRNVQENGEVGQIKRSATDLLEEQMILEALEDVENGRVFTTEEVKEKIEQWKEKKISDSKTVGYQTDGSRITQLDLERSIIESQQQLEAGEFVTIGELEEESKSWLQKSTRL